MLKAEETIKTLKVPTLREKIQQALPIPISPAETRRRMICEVAEEIHPGCWSLDDPERDVKKILDRSLRPIGGKICKCIDCSNSNSSNCKYNRNLPRTRRLVIRIPSVTIKNSRGDEHYIEDFYIMIGISDDYSKATTTNMFSMRSTVTTEEYSAGAFHPHSSHKGTNSPLIDFFRWRNMCLGGDTELTDLMFTLYSDGIDKKSLFELLVLLHVYAGWESLEGGPYRTMRNYKYPRDSGRGNGLSYPGEKIFTSTLEQLATNDSFARPEIVGRNTYLAVSNISSSITPAIKLALLSYVKEGEERTSEIMSRTMLQFLGNINEQGVFQGLFGDTTRGATKRSRSWYVGKIAETAQFSEDNGHHILKFNGKTNFIMKLKEEGLEEGGVTGVTDAQLAAATVNPEVVQLITKTYISKFKEFKSFEKY